MRAFLAAARLQLQVVAADRDYLLSLAVAPLFAVVFLAVVRHAGRADLQATAILAPVLIALWATSLHVAGDIVDVDRGQRVLEPLLATPTAFPVLVLARVWTVTALGLVSFAESALVARVGFGVTLHVHHPVVFALALVATATAMAGTALGMAGLFVLARNARTFQNSLSYPFYVLGGVIAPVSLLPGWVHPLARVVFLSWSAELLRDAAGPAPVAGAGFRLGMVLLLGAAGFAGGGVLLRTVLRRVRVTGTLAHV